MSDERADLARYRRNLQGEVVLALFGIGAATAASPGAAPGSRACARS